MATRSGAIANDAVAEQAAQEFLSLGGSAVGAVLSGFFAAAGAYAGVLLGPVSVLVGAVGSGVRAFDGRPRQPGMGVKRPRGFRSTEPIPDAARVAIPTAVAAVLVAHAYDGSQKLGGIIKAGTRQARRSGADSRAALLSRVRAAGAAALTEAEFARALMRVAGASQGGVITPADFGTVPEIDQVATPRTVGDVELLEPPWAAQPGEPAPGSDIGTGSAVCAVDVRGVFAALCYRRVHDGFPIDEVELEAPLCAAPVQRSVERVAPGSRLPIPAPIAIRVDRSRVPVEVLCAPRARVIDEMALRTSPWRLRRDPQTQAVQVVAPAVAP
jgi:hypothetical protein